MHVSIELTFMVKLETFDVTCLQNIPQELVFSDAMKIIYE